MRMQLSIMVGLILAAGSALAHDRDRGNYTRVDVPGVIHYENGSHTDYYSYRRPSQRFCPPGHAKKGWC